MKVYVRLSTSTGGSTEVEHEKGNAFFGAEALAMVSQAAEKAGFYGVYVTDHPFPADSALKMGIGHHSLEPLVPLAVAAAATKRLRVCTHVYILPYRNPFMIARGMASLDVVSGGRLILGVGPGWMEGEFEALGVDFKERNELTDESIRAMKVAWSQTGIHMDGRHFKVRGNSMLPHPVQKPHPPIYIGGASKRAARRAGELGDGFVPFMNPAKYAAARHTGSLESLDELRALVTHAQSVAKANGRPPLEVGCSTFGVVQYGDRGFELQRYVENVRQLHAMGVRSLLLGFSADTPKEHADKMLGFGREVLPHLP